MICCPKCGHDSVVTETRKTSPQQARRRRRCIGCRNKFTTMEILVSSPWKTTKGEVVPISKVHLQQIADLVCHALLVEPSDPQPTPTGEATTP